MSSSPSRSGDTLPFVFNSQKQGKSFMALMVAVVALPLAMILVEEIVDRIVPCFKTRGRHRMTP